MAVRPQPLAYELLHCIRCGVDFTFATPNPSLIHPLASTLLFFNFFVLLLIQVGLFPGAGDLSSGTDGQFYTALTLRRELVDDYLPGYTFYADRALYALNLLCAILPLLATSSMHRFRGVYHVVSLLLLFVALVMDAALVFPSITIISPWLSFASAIDKQPGTEIFVLLTLRVVIRTIMFFILKAALFLVLLSTGRPGAPQDATSVLWHSALSALTPEPALWTLPWESKPMDCLRAVAAGGFAGLARSAYSLVVCVPSKHLTAALLSFTLLTLIVTVFAVDFGQIEADSRSLQDLFDSLIEDVQDIPPDAVPESVRTALLIAVSAASILFSLIRDFFFAARPAYWIVYSTSVLSICASLVFTARDHLRVMFSFPCPSHISEMPTPPFLAQGTSARSLRLHRKGDAPPGWSASVPFYAGPWYKATKGCGLGGQPDGPRPASGLPIKGDDADASSSSGAPSPLADSSSAVTYELPDVSPRLDSNLVSSYSYIPYYVLSQAFFVVYVGILVGAGLMALLSALRNLDILELVLELIIGAVLGRRAIDFVLHYLLTLDGVIVRPTLWLVLEPYLALASLFLSAPGFTLRFLIAVVEGVVRSTFLHRSSSSSALAALDGGYGAYIAMLKVRYMPLYTTAYSPRVFEHQDAHFFSCAACSGSGSSSDSSSSGSGSGSAEAAAPGLAHQHVPPTAWGEGGAAKVAVNPLV